MAVKIPVSWGELFDKLTILEIKQVRISDPKKLINIDKEFEALSGAYRGSTLPGAPLQELIDELRRTNEALWEIEDDIRNCERTKDFSERFIELARSVYKTNDKRADLKLRINRLLGSELIEEKSYEKY
ncbi:MAG: hypothetical protein HKP52_05270 [Desulfofustis sp.]|nr:hypothetical protein [Desulfofustis sp.]NNK13630.1 hypothetical protein [Desulfofustis sp.]